MLAQCEAWDDIGRCPAFVRVSGKTIIAGVHIVCAEHAVRGTSGRKPLYENPVHITVYLPATLKGQLRGFARARGESLNATLVRGLEMFARHERRKEIQDAAWEVITGDTGPAEADGEGTS